MDGDVYFEPTLVSRLLEGPAENLLLVDTRSVNSGEEIMAGARGGRLVEIGRGMGGDFDVYGEWVGFLRASRSAALPTAPRRQPGAKGTLREGRGSGAFDRSRSGLSSIREHSGKVASC